jgi:Ring finger domain
MDSHELLQRQLRSTGELAVNIVVYIAVLTGIVLCMLLFTYASTMIADLISRLLNPPTPNTMTDPEQGGVVVDRRSIEDYDRGAIARQANLWGLQNSERQLILQKLFPTMSFEYNVKEIPTVNAVSSHVASGRDDDESKGAKSCIDIEMKTITASDVAPADTRTIADAPMQSTDNATSENDDATDVNDITAEQGTDDVALPNDMDHFRMCAICLTAYDQGVRVMTGVQCPHMFHETCCQQWLLKHDHCPYCRKNMILSSDFRTAAVQTLGEDRMAELSVIPPTRSQAPQPEQPHRIIVLG